MALYLWLPALLLAALLDIQPALAGASICNDTGELHYLAVSSRSSSGWATTGWKPLLPEECMDPLPQGHQGRFYYFRAEGPGHKFSDDGVRFCTAPGRFRIEGGKNCVSRGYSERGFAKERAGAAGGQVLLSARSQQTGAANAAAPGNNESLAVEVVFQGCARLRGNARVRCRFVGGGMEISTEGHHGFSDPQFTILQGLPSGAPLVVDGVLTASFGPYGELALRSVTLRQPNRFDRMLQQIQGEWLSLADPEDRFTITGSIRRAFYYGSRMAPEVVSVQGSCRGLTLPGDFLMAWDREGGSSLCYRIKKLTGDRLTLEYLPRGTELAYHRRP